ncbi:hypothetical protein F7725_017525 [Dissostichus mawsoni]|uniref:Uncharacterized protein n=1 Tax=Dissostichus mawsoni TaxID=36200 RepID=A0A7J5Z4P1_DISMA|nr:hypothetical protein F7725_017525 [Dissostichus mawsoni]
MVTRSSLAVNTSPWLTEDTHILKRHCRKVERLWKTTNLQIRQARLSLLASFPVFFLGWERRRSACAAGELLRDTERQLEEVDAISGSVSGPDQNPAGSWDTDRRESRQEEGTFKLGCESISSQQPCTLCLPCSTETRINSH